MSIEQEYDNIFRYALYHTGCREDAEDITQETFLRYVEHTEYHKFGTERQVLYTIARNLCIDMHRKAKNEPLADDIPDSSPDIVDGVAVRLAMSRLSDEDRDIAVLRLVNGETISVIAKIFGMTRFTMSRRINRIIKQLKDELKETTGKEDAHEQQIEKHA